MKFKCGLKLRRWFELKLATMGHHATAFSGDHIIFCYKYVLSIILSIFSIDNFSITHPRDKVR